MKFIVPCLCIQNMQLTLYIGLYNCVVSSNYKTKVRITVMGGRGHVKTQLISEKKVWKKLTSLGI